jgi:hypothetical protein
MVPKRARSPTPSQGAIKLEKPAYTASQGREWLLAELDNLEQSYKSALYYIGMIMRFHADIRKA